MILLYQVQTTVVLNILLTGLQTVGWKNQLCFLVFVWVLVYLVIDII